MQTACCRAASPSSGTSSGSVRSGRPGAGARARSRTRSRTGSRRAAAAASPPSSSRSGRRGAPLHRARRRRARRAAREPSSSRAGSSSTRRPTSAAALGVHPGRRARRADDHDGRAEARGRAGTTTGCRGTSSPTMDAVFFVAGDVDALVARAPRARADGRRRASSSARAGGVVARRADRERRGRGRALPRGRSRPRADARRHDVGRPRRLDAAGRAVQRGAPPGEIVDSYGAGDCFAAGLTFALASGLEAHEAVAFAARCGAAALTGRGVAPQPVPLADPARTPASTRRPSRASSGDLPAVA